MEETETYYVVKKRALPEVLLKVVEVNRLLETQKVSSVQEAVEDVGISRSSYYKYKKDIFPFHDSTQGKTLTLACSMDDEPGLLSDVLKVVADTGPVYTDDSSDDTYQWNRVPVTQHTDFRCVK